MAFSTLKRVFGIEHTLAKTLVGLATTIVAKIAAYTYAFYVNRLLGSPQAAPLDLGHPIFAEYLDGNSAKRVPVRVDSSAVLGAYTNPAVALAQNRLLDPEFLFWRAFFPEYIHASPQLFRGLLWRRVRSYLREVVARFLRCGPSMLAGALNIPDVPFAVRSGREEDKVFPLQQVDPVLSVGPNDLAQRLRYIVISQSPLLSVQGSKN